MALWCMCLLMQVKFSKCVCVVGATCTFRPECQGRTIFSSVTGWSPAPFPGSDAGSLASSAFPCLRCLPPVPGCESPRLARRRGKSAFDGPVGTGGGDGRGCGENESPGRSSMHWLTGLDTEKAHSPGLAPFLHQPPGLIDWPAEPRPIPQCLPGLHVRRHLSWAMSRSS